MKRHEKYLIGQTIRQGKEETLYFPDCKYRLMVGRKIKKKRKVGC